MVMVPEVKIHAISHIAAAEERKYRLNNDGYGLVTPVIETL